jgi:2-amino-4-hydroxy-6-hydroxymethyldihydropteridine diphosphokinase
MIFIALGANLPSTYGDPFATLFAAKQAIESRDIKIIHHSRIWLTAPVPISDQPWFHNAVISVETNLSAYDLLMALHDIEHQFGRVRIELNEARFLDLDLIAYHDEIIQDNNFVVPHPRAHERAFVLLPLNDIAPEWVHPSSQQQIDELIKLLPNDQLAYPMVHADES